MYRISALAPANPASGPILEIRPNPAPARILTGFGRIWGSCFVWKNIIDNS